MIIPTRVGGTANGAWGVKRGAWGVGRAACLAVVLLQAPHGLLRGVEPPGPPAVGAVHLEGQRTRHWGRPQRGRGALCAAARVALKITARQIAAAAAGRRARAQRTEAPRASQAPRASPGLVGSSEGGRAVWRSRARRARRARHRGRRGPPGPTQSSRAGCRSHTASTTAQQRANGDCRLCTVVSTGAGPKLNDERPPGGASTREELLPVMWLLRFCDCDIGEPGRKRDAAT